MTDIEHWTIEGDTHEDALIRVSGPPIRRGEQRRVVPESEPLTTPDGADRGAVDRAEQAALGVIDGYLAQFGIEYAESQYDGLHKDVTAAVLDALQGGR